MLRVVFMGTPEFAVPSLVAIHSSFELVAVYTQPDRPVGRGLEVRISAVKARALEMGVPIIQPERLSQPGEFEKLQELKPDVIVVVAYGQILKKNVLELPLLGCVNVHSSLLPRWRGAAPIQWALLSGDQVTGVTTMRLVQELDAGDILLQDQTPISAEDTASSLHDRLAEMGARLIGPTLAGLEAKTLQGQAQDSSQVTYASKLNKEMEWLNPDRETAAQLDRKVRALNPWPGTSLLLGERLKVKQVKVRDDIHGTPGLVFEKAGMLLLGTSQGSLELKVLQWEGKKSVDAAGFLNGLHGRGQKLPLRVGTPEKSSMVES